VADEFDLCPYIDPRLSKDVLKYLERPIKSALTTINCTNILETEIPQSNGASITIAEGSEGNIQGSTLRIRPRGAGRSPNSLEL
jgi:hypothetical protein